MNYDDSSMYYYENNSPFKMDREIDLLKTQTKENAAIIENFRSEQEAFSIKYFQLQQINERFNRAQQSANNELQQLPQYGMNNGHQQTSNHQFETNRLAEMKQTCEYELQGKINMLGNLQRLIADKLETNSSSISNMIEMAIDKELVSWKRKQQLAGNGCTCDTSYLDVLQRWCEGLAEVIWTNLAKLKEAMRIARVIAPVTQDSQTVSQRLSDLNKEFMEHLSRIVLNTFILEKQPPQVMKTNTRFSTKARFLVGNKLNIHMSPPQVKVAIISEYQANQMVTEKSLQGEASGDILNNTGTMEYDQATKQLSISFRNMQLKKIRRAEKKASESVVDEKFALFVSSKFTLAGNLDFEVWTMSLPVTVIVHGNQEGHAWATITWDNAFSKPSRNPFVVPDKVPWGELATVLDLKCNAITGRFLSAEPLKYFAEKIFRTPSPVTNGKYEIEVRSVSWSMFCKEPLPNRSFTFWDWFYSILKLIKDHLKPLWTDGLILGFLRKQDAETMLANYPIGTFLLRFSDSELGGITIAWVGQGPNEEKTVTMLQPFTAKDFAIRTLADRLGDLAHLMYLYPDTPKDKAFSRYYTPNAQISENGYLQPLLVTHVPGLATPTCTTTAGIDNNHEPLNFMARSPSFFSPGSPSDIKPLISGMVGESPHNFNIECFDLDMDQMDGSSNPCF